MKSGKERRAKRAYGAMLASIAAPVYRSLMESQWLALARIIRPTRAMRKAHKGKHGSEASAIRFNGWKAGPQLPGSSLTQESAPDAE